MHTIVRRFIKAGIGFLAVGLGLGLWLLVRRELGGGYNAYIASAHAHAILAGFGMFLIMGVGLWLFPRPEKTDTRYRPERAEAVFWLLAVSTAVRVAGELARAVAGPQWLRWALVIAGAGQALGILLYFWLVWTRIRPVGSHLREARGERF